MHNEIIYSIISSNSFIFAGWLEGREGNGILLMLTAFFDETAKDSSALLMAGFLGRVEDWERLSDAWDECLGSHPKIEYFKWKEANGLSDQFWRFDSPSAYAKKLALANVIARFPEVNGFCVGVENAAFSERDPDISKSRAGSRPYDWAFMTTVSVVLSFADIKYPGDDQIDFIFDECSELKACKGFFSNAKEDPLIGSSVMYRARRMLRAQRYQDSCSPDGRSACWRVCAV